MKEALITGQDGSYLAEFLIQKGYEVHGIIRAVHSIQARRENFCNRYSFGYFNNPIS